MTVGLFLIVLMVAVFFAFLTDYSVFRWHRHKEVEESWKALNDKLERTGRERLDKKK